MPGDVAGLSEGELRYTVFTNAQGGVLDDLIVGRADQGLFVVANAARRDVDLAHMRQALEPEHRVEELDDRALLALQGPHAAEVLGRLCPASRELAFMRTTTATVAGISCRVSRCGYTGEDGFEISVAATDAQTLARRLLEEPEVAPVGLGARDSLRLEAGLCLYGHELTQKTTPVEAGLPWTIARRRRSAGDFPGADIILRQLQDGPERRLVGIRPEGRAPAREGTVIEDRWRPAHRRGDQRRLRADRRRADRARLRACAARGAGNRAAAVDPRQAASGQGGRAALRPTPLPALKECLPCPTSATPRSMSGSAWTATDATVGISDYAQQQLGDVVFIELPEIGRQVSQGGNMAVVESVKAASDVYAPISGEVVETNSALENDPALVNRSAEDEGWFCRLRIGDRSELTQLMDVEAYKAYVAGLS